VNPSSDCKVTGRFLPSEPCLVYVHANHGAPPDVALGPIVDLYVPDQGASIGAIRMRVRAIFAKLHAKVSVAPGPSQKIARAGIEPAPVPYILGFSIRPKFHVLASW
jgi:hypothetical protein